MVEPAEAARWARAAALAIALAVLAAVGAAGTQEEVAGKFDYQVGTSDLETLTKEDLARMEPLRLRSGFVKGLLRKFSFTPQQCVTWEGTVKGHSSSRPFFTDLAVDLAYDAQVPSASQRDKYFGPREGRFPAAARAGHTVRDETWGAFAAKADDAEVSSDTYFHASTEIGHAAPGVLRQLKGWDTQLHLNETAAGTLRWSGYEINPPALFVSVSSDGTRTAPYSLDTHSVFVQLHGSTVVRLYPPAVRHDMYPYPAAHQMAGVSQVPLDEQGELAGSADDFPRWKHGVAQAVTVLLKAGDVLYVPPLYFYDTKAVGTSIRANVLSWSKYRAYHDQVAKIPLLPKTEDVKWPDKMQLPLLQYCLYLLLEGLGYHPSLWVTEYMKSRYRPLAKAMPDLIGATHEEALVIAGVIFRDEGLRYTVGAGQCFNYRDAVPWQGQLWPYPRPFVSSNACEKELVKHANVNKVVRAFREIGDMKHEAALAAAAEDYVEAQVARFVGNSEVYSYLWGCFHTLHGVVRTHHMKQSWPSPDEQELEYEYEIEYSLGNCWPTKNGRCARPKKRYHH